MDDKYATHLRELRHHNEGEGKGPAERLENTNERTNECKERMLFSRKMHSLNRSLKAQPAEIL